MQGTIKIKDEWVLFREPLFNLSNILWNNYPERWKNMKNVYEVFDENLNILIDTINVINLKNCFRISVDLTMYSLMSEFKEGVFISELLESVFSQVGPLFDEYDINPDIEFEMIERMKKLLIKIRDNYKESNKDELYSSLIELRYIATKFQSMCFNIMKKKPAEIEMGEY